ncbi:MAG: 2-hydroxy-3-oxopropionate reductase [Spirochaetales bacterium]|nr:2-hydroxy-3-oxopropionate reductase [Spirochaetales bacterium]
MAEKLGFIGLGVMGGHMARHLSEAQKVIVFDIDPEKKTAIRSAEKAASIQEVGTAASIVFLSLPSSDVVRDVVLGTEGLIGVLDSGAAVIDLSTTEPTISQEIATALRDRNVDFLDAPVSGGEGAAKDASLAIMAGGPEDVFARFKPFLEIVGKSVVRVGDSGMGGVAKLVNNMIVGATFSVVAEGFALGMKSGIDPQVLYDAIRGGWAGSNVLDVAAPGIINRDFKPGGSIDILFKDIGYALSLARSQNVPVPMTAMADEIFKAARASGRGPFAQQIIVEMWEELLGIDPDKKS